MSRAGFAPRLDRTIESSPRAPSEARRAVEGLAAEFDLSDPRDIALMRDAQLLVSELVTNSVRHSGSDDPIRVRAWLRDKGLKLEISDGGFGFERTRESSSPDAVSGRGLLILDSLTDRWGISRDTHTRVWFELSHRPQSGRRHQAAS